MALKENGLGTGRRLGVVGLYGSFGCVYNPGPLGAWDEGEYVPEPYFTPGAMGVGSDLAARLAQPAEPSADERELKLMTEVYGTLLNASAKLSYSFRHKKQTKYRVQEYVADRDVWIYAGAAYIKYLDLCRTELDANGEMLRKYIEPPPGVRKKVADWRSAQNVFYAWVRKGYEKSLGNDSDIPKLIKAQMSETLKTKLEQVKHDFGKGFQYGGFNPRPMKKHGYRLGTISDHAMGTAVDIESARNPQLLAREWKALLDFTDETADHSSDTWTKTPKVVWDGIKSVNDAWVEQLAEALKDAEDAAKQTAAAATQSGGKKLASTPSALDLAVAAHPELKSLGKSFIQQWGNGFFNLPWELVKELHEEGFLWGATFRDLDLHHFEL